MSLLKNLLLDTAAYLRTLSGFSHTEIIQAYAGKVLARPVLKPVIVVGINCLQLENQNSLTDKAELVIGIPIKYELRIQLVAPSSHGGETCVTLFDLLCEAYFGTQSTAPVPDMIFCNPITFNDQGYYCCMDVVLSFHGTAESEGAL